MTVRLLENGSNRLLESGVIRLLEPIVTPDPNPITATVRDRGHTATIEDDGHTMTARAV